MRPLHHQLFPCGSQDVIFIIGVCNGDMGSVDMVMAVKDTFDIVKVKEGSLACLLGF